MRLLFVQVDKDNMTRMSCRGLLRVQQFLKVLRGRGSAGPRGTRKAEQRAAGQRSGGAGGGRGRGGGGGQTGGVLAGGRGKEGERQRLSGVQGVAGTTGVRWNDRDVRRGAGVAEGLTSAGAARGVLGTGAAGGCAATPSATAFTHEHTSSFGTVSDTI